MNNKQKIDLIRAYQEYLLKTKKMAGADYLTKDGILIEREEAADTAVQKGDQS